MFPRGGRRFGQMEVIREPLERFASSSESVYLVVDDVASILFRLDGGSTSAAPDRVRVPFHSFDPGVAHRHVAFSLCVKSRTVAGS